MRIRNQESGIRNKESGRFVNRYNNSDKSPLALAALVEVLFEGGIIRRGLGQVHGVLAQRIERGKQAFDNLGCEWPMPGLHR